MAYSMQNPTPGFCRLCGKDGLPNKRSQYHDQCKPAKRSRARTAPRVVSRETMQDDNVTTIGVVRDIASAPGAGRTKAPTGAPRAEEWELRLSKIAVYATYFAGRHVARNEPTPGDRGRAAIALSFTDEEAHAIARVPARMIAESDLNTKAGRKLLEALELTEPFTAIIACAERFREYGKTAAVHTPGEPRTVRTYPVTPATGEVFDAPRPAAGPIPDEEDTRPPGVPAPPRFDPSNGPPSFLAAEGN